ncbi:MAG: glutamate--tRNA ligase family protein [bacterium]|nr:glutamate--tRNA ligase family protein [bacterium]
MHKKLSDLLKPFRRPKVVTRFAPSPTGLLHSGNYRTAVFSYLYARQHGGKFILRIEDTDKARSKKEYEDNIFESLEWLGLEYDEMYRQSDRTDIYVEYLQKLIDDDKAYVSKEPAKDDPTRTVELVRFRNPNKKITFTDLIRGDIEFDTSDLGDFVIARSMTEPVFHFVVVVDDHLMGVTHIVRGEDHISNTPRHLLIYEALSAPKPTYAHLPLVLASDRSKLSKRHGAKPMTYYRDTGYMPAALLNYMSLLGWNPGTEQEIFDLKGLVKAFDLSKVQKGGAIFNEDKLRWVNKEHLKLLPKDNFTAVLKARIDATERAKELGWNVTPELAAKLGPAVLERINNYGDIDIMITERDLDYYFSDPAYDAESLRWKGESVQASATHLEFIQETIKSISEKNWDEGSIKAALWPYAEEHGRGNVLWPFRYALAGKDKSPNPFTIAGIIGKDATARRVHEALKKCANHADKPLT